MKRTLITLGLTGALMLGLASAAAGASTTRLGATVAMLYVDPANAGVVRTWMNPDRYDMLVESGVIAPTRAGLTRGWMNPDRYDRLVEDGILA